MYRHLPVHRGAPLRVHGLSWGLHPMTLQHRTPADVEPYIPQWAKRTYRELWGVWHDGWIVCDPGDGRPAAWETERGADAAAEQLGRGYAVQIWKRERERKLT
jgi:hypothetical protein